MRNGADADHHSSDYVIYRRRNGFTLGATVLRRSTVRALLLSGATAIITAAGGTTYTLREALLARNTAVAMAAEASAQIDRLRTDLTLSNTQLTSVQAVLDDTRTRLRGAERDREVADLRASQADALTRVAETRAIEADAYSRSVQGRNTILEDSFGVRLSRAQADFQTALVETQRSASAACAATVSAANATAAESIEMLRTRLAEAQTGLATEKRYSGDLMRYARAQRTLADRAATHAQAIASSSQQITQDSLSILAGSAPRPRPTSASPDPDLATAHREFQQFIQTAHSMPLASPLQAVSTQPVATSAGIPAAALALVAESEAPVIATAAGRITFAGRSSNEGLLVEIDHGRGITTRYRRMASIDVKAGDGITAGSRIGIASSIRGGQSGISYEIIIDGRPVPPAQALERGAQLIHALQQHEARIARR